MQKTNAMRQLDSAKINYTPLEYEVDENDLSGESIARKVGLPEEQVFKTLVGKGDKTGVVVLCIPVCCEVDLKKAATASGNKKLELLAVKDLLATTGYIRGGCSPIGMKKKFPTYFDESALLYDKITVSAGVKGIQLLLDPNDLTPFVEAELFDLTV